LHAVAFDSTSYSEPAKLQARLDPNHSTRTAKPMLARYQVKSRDDNLDLDLSTDRRALRGQHKHATQPYVSAVSNVVMLNAVAPAKKDRQRQLKSAKGSPLD
jgi:hypothetical protein